MRDPLIDEMSRAQDHALACAIELFGAKRFHELVRRIPDPAFEFQDAYDIDRLHLFLETHQSTERLQLFLAHHSTASDHIVVAWAMHSVIQDVEECKLNRGEHHFARYKDLLTDPPPTPWAVCLAGVQKLRLFWRG